MSKKRPEPPILPRFIDTHFHALQSSNKGIDVPKTVQMAIENGMDYCVEVGIHPNELNRRLALLPDHPAILRSSGLGPSESGTATENDYALLETQTADSSICAIGETGLDWYRNYAPKTDQIAAFERQLSIAREAALPVIIHNRDADDDMIGMLRSAALPRAGVMHCFSSTWKTAVAALDMGYFISFSGNVTYKNADDLREVARQVPADRLLIETDAPYLAPEPVRGTVNTPLNCPFIYQLLASIRTTQVQDLVSQVGRNAKTLFLPTR